ncbi:adenosine deaminase [Corallococcus exiguus]|uniref:adenosine deaminase n=1 Tax=Corallococcus TaxID=83461 RepID=UPI000EDDB1D6|nr:MULTISPECIES: adenosine deaminase [Corallococcus]NNB86200.1 adenosine deaminase [Corallococcus exiguus]NNB95595.1 adenosine deaminase [Corallococcus exiguus]NNC04220.1 adenosine deaminase [Corallococcus exiguus]NPC48389.1 adenosine deaminase [Corallococcus exiguus]RKH78181.1 adenosine deaminase [Corallococcus sp. AB032C]
MVRDLIDLHIHVGGAVAPHILWSIAHQQGFKLPVKNYFDFVELITSRPGKVGSLDDYLKILHTWTEKIQSSPSAIERSVYEVIGKEYRGSRVTQIELRFNPMKRNLSSELDLDHIIHAALRGMDRATLEYGVKVGLIFCLAREFDHKLNSIIVEKAIKYRSRGVYGIDLAGTERDAMEHKASLAEYEDLYARARKAGLKCTVHTGETAGTGANGLMAAVEKLKPHRIGHGIRAAYDESAMKILRENNITLELCPTSNIHTKAVEDLQELKHIMQTFWDRKVKFTINTDGPYLLETDMRREIEIVESNGLLSTEQVDQALAWAREASFIPA